MDGQKTSGTNAWVIPLMIMCIFLMNMKMTSEGDDTRNISYRNIKLMS